jgi:RHS repeat-associated protein
MAKEIGEAMAPQLHGWTPYRKIPKYDYNARSVVTTIGNACSSAQRPCFFGNSTGKERDAETGLDFFLARYYSAAEGRFITPDWSSRPEPVPYARLDNPQTLNLYAYVKNNPLRYTDPDGHADVVAMCGDKRECHVTVSQTVGLFKGKTLKSTIGLEMDFTVTRDKNGKVSVAVSSKATNISGDKLSASKLATIGSISGAIQQSAALRGFGETTTQAMTALGDAETVFGTAKAGESASWKKPSINPLQLSGGRAKGHTLQQNISGALDVWEDVGEHHNFDPKKTYAHGYSDGRTNSTDHFDAIYDSIQETATPK